jgi:hypothetical protein
MPPRELTDFIHTMLLSDSDETRLAISKAVEREACLPNGMKSITDALSNVCASDCDVWRLSRLFSALEIVAKNLLDPFLTVLWNFLLEHLQQQQTYANSVMRDEKAHAMQNVFFNAFWTVSMMCKNVGIITSEAQRHFRNGCVSLCLYFEQSNQVQLKVAVMKLMLLNIS